MNLEFLDITGENCGSYQQLYMSFDSGFTQITGINHDADGSNGAGKSTMHKLFFYILFGHTSSGLREKELTHDLGGKLLGKLRFKKDNKIYEITRGANTLELVDPDFPDLKNKPDIQKRIEELIELPEATLTLLMLFNSESAKFAKVGPAVRRDMFTALFKELSQYQDLYGKALSNQLQAEEREANQLATEANQLYGRTGAIQQTIAATEQALTNLNGPSEAVLAQIAALNSQETEYKRVVEYEQAYLLGYFQNMEDVTTYIQGCADHVKRLDQMRRDRDALIYEHKLQENAYARNQANAATYAKELDEYTQISQQGMCPTCGQTLPLDQSKFQAALAEKQSRHDVALKAARESGEAAAALALKVAEHEDQITTWVPHVLKFQELKQHYDQLTSARNQAQNISAQVMTLSAQASVEGQRTMLTTQLAQNKKELEELQEQYNGVMNAYGAVRHRIDGFKILIKLSQNDIPNALISEYLQQLEAESSEILGRIFPGMTLRITDSKQTTKNVTKYETNVTIISPNGKEKRYETYSDGEKQAIDIAILFGMQRLVINHTGMRINVLFLDEAVDLSVDNVRLEEIIAFLEQEACNYSAMFLISHKYLGGNFDRSLTVEKSKGVSTIKSY